jgi:putative hemolysin
MFWLHWLNPANEFTKRFELALADNPEIRDEVFRLRHKVFCEELGFYPTNAEGRERDERRTLASSVVAVPQDGDLGGLHSADIGVR